MALRFRTITAVAVAGTTIPHGLGATPDEITATALTAAGNIYMITASAANSTNVYLAANAASSALVIAAVTHSIIL